MILKVKYKYWSLDHTSHSPSMAEAFLAVLSPFLCPNVVRQSQVTNAYQRSMSRINLCLFQTKALRALFSAMGTWKSPVLDGRAVRCQGLDFEEPFGKELL